MNSEISIRDYTRNAYISFGREMNIKRHLPYIYDGLKPVWQRMIISSLEFKDFIKSSTLAGICIGKYHPHGDKQIKKVISKLVSLNILEGQGNFGYRFLNGDEADSAAMRYTEVRLNPEIKNQISKFMEFVPKTVSEAGYEMPQYIPSPLPLALIGGDSGVAIGINQKIPAFTAKSLLEAYTKDDPSLLESQYGLKLDKSQSTLSKLWETGAGRIYLEMKVTDDSQGATIEGDTSIFVPDLSYLFQEFKWGNLDYQDLSAEVGKIRFSRPPRSRKFAVSYIQHLLHEAAKWNSPYYIRVHDGNKGFPISMRTWIDVCYKNYSKLASYGIDQEIKRLERKIYFYTNLKDVYSELVNTKKSKQDIASFKNVDLDLVKSIASKSADYVRHCDTGKEIKSCEDKIHDLRNNSIRNLIESYVGVLK